MKLAITDACIFIDLIELRLSSQFFSLKIEIHTTLDVYNELYPEQQEVLLAYHSTGLLKVHNLSETERNEMKEMKFPKSLSDVDKSVIFIARKIDAMVLSSDKVIRDFAKTNVIECHGLLWIFDKLVENALIARSEAINKITRLSETNIIYRNNLQLISEIEKRIKRWE